VRIGNCAAMSLKLWLRRWSAPCRALFTETRGTHRRHLQTRSRPLPVDRTAHPNGSMNGAKMGQTCQTRTRGTTGDEAEGGSSSLDNQTLHQLVSSPSGNRARPQPRLCDSAVLANLDWCSSFYEPADVSTSQNTRRRSKINHNGS
jgi:hypothetical protein